MFESTPAAVCLEFPDLEFDGNTFVLFELEIVLCCVRLVSQFRVGVGIAPRFLFPLASLLLSELCSPPEYPSHLHKLCTIYFSDRLTQERERVSFNYLDTPGTKKSASGELLFWLLLFI